MTYVLLFVGNTNEPRYLQGTLSEINRELRKAWEYYQNWILLGVEDGRLTPVERCVMNMVPQIEVI